MRLASLFAVLVLLVVVGLNLCAGKCNDFLDSTSETGHMQPDEDMQVEETTTLELFCSLSASFRERNNLDAKAVFWERRRTVHTEGAYFSDQLSALVRDERFRHEALNDSTAKMTLHNSTIKDSGQYKCLVNASSDDEHGRFVCAVTVTVGGPPKKYKDFECQSIDLKNLTCTFSRDDSYYGRSVTKFDISYHVVLATNTIYKRNCTTLSRSQKGQRYSCYIGNSKEQRKAACSNTSCHPAFLNQYEHVFTIRGTNPQGTRTWTEKIQPREKIRLSKPTKLSASALDSHSCTVGWQISPELQASDILTEIGVVDQVRYRKMGIDDGWTDAITRELQEKRISLEHLDAYATYEIQVRSRMANNDLWSSYSQITCTTPACVPERPPGVVPGAFEQIDYGDDRRVTLYWKGVPKDKRNGKDFGYHVYTWLDGRPVEDKILQHTFNPSFENIVLRVPSKTAVNVEIVPYNEVGNAPPQMIERVQIPALQYSRLQVKDIRVVSVSATQVEISWSSAQKADAFDLFICPIPSESRLDGCMDTMIHRSLSGDTFVHNFTRERGTHYRFAVAARAVLTDSPAGLREIVSGMTWARRFCSADQNYDRVDGLSVTPLANGTVAVKWATPCVERFMKIPGYQVKYYPCDIDTVCDADKMLRTNETAVLISGLKENTRYCFVVEVLHNSDSNITFDPVKECVVTAAAGAGGSDADLVTDDNVMFPKFLNTYSVFTLMLHMPYPQNFIKEISFGHVGPASRGIKRSYRLIEDN